MNLPKQNSLLLSGMYVPGVFSRTKIVVAQTLENTILAMFLKPFLKQDFMNYWSHIMAF
jgi:hypothetical protein